MDSEVERPLTRYPNDFNAREYRRMIEDGMFARGTSTDPRIGVVSRADIRHLASSRKLTWCSPSCFRREPGLLPTGSGAFLGSNACGQS